MRPDFSHPCVWTALQVVLINRNRKIHLWNTHHLQVNQLVYHHIITYSMPLMMLLFGQQDQLGSEDHKKVIHFNKITLNVFIHCIPIFGNIWQNRCTIILKNTINFFLNNVSIRHYIFYWWNDFIGNIFLSVLQRLFNFWQNISKNI